LIIACSTVKSVDEVLHNLSTDAVQSQERLLYELKKRQRDETKSETSSSISDQSIEQFVIFSIYKLNTEDPPPSPLAIYCLSDIGRRRG